MFSTRPLFVNTHWVLERGIIEPIVIVRRTANPYAALVEVRASFDALTQVFDTLDRRNLSVLADMRLAPPRDDPEFDRAAADQPNHLSRDFVRSAVLIRTATGLLHVQRHMQRLGLPMKVFSDEAQAIEYLRGRMDPPSARGGTIPPRRG